MAQTNAQSSAPAVEATTVSRKKQKQRDRKAEKKAAKAAAEQANGANGASRAGKAAGENAGVQYPAGDTGDSDEDEDRGKKKKSRPNNRDASSQIPPPPPPPPPPPESAQRPSIPKEKLWNNSPAETRERIKDFWLSLGEDERKSLVKVEKDAVLKKMKEQQKHSCSCNVCGRKRLAIEEELEVLYDAYYEELEQYANNRQGVPPMMRTRRLGTMSGFHSPRQLPPSFHASRGRIENLGDEDLDEEGEDEYSEDEADEEEYSEDEPQEVPSHASEFFNFGNSLTVKGGILTVADDLLKNDGKKFIEMMEQLAERRMAREEESERQYASGSYHANGMTSQHPHHAGHNHPPPQPDEEYDEEDEDDEEEYASDEEDYDDEEMESMTEEQRMEEGRRMFQIFAARMFEQRVLAAYQEKVANERQQALLEMESKEKEEQKRKEAKKAKEAQKRKEKNQQKKQALAEEKAKREAEEAEKLAAQRAIEEQKAEEQRLRQEEKRKKREAQKKTEEEERLRKEAEKQRRIQEQRERQAETERKAREAKEREKKDKEAARLKAQEAKEAKEREARERKERIENERKEKEAKAKEIQKQAEKRKMLDEQAANAEREEARKKSMSSATYPLPSASHQPAKRPVQQPISIPIPPGLQPHPMISPQVQVAMPILPKAPTPVRPRTISQQHESSSVPLPQTPQYGPGKSQDSSPLAPSTPQQSSPSVLGSGSNKPYLHHPQASSPIHAALRGSPGPMHPGLPAGMHPMAMNGFAPQLPPMYTNSSRMPFDPMFAHQPSNNGYRAQPPPGMPIHGPPPMPQSRAFPYGPPGFQQQAPSGPLSNIMQSFSPMKENPSSQSHSRSVSGSYENGHPPGISSQPIAKPTPIGRPSSVVHGQRRGSNRHDKDVDELSSHLGSSALLDDSDEPFTNSRGPRRASIAPGASRGGFSNGGSFMDQSGLYGSWSHSSNPFGGSSLPGANTWGGNAPSTLGGWSQQPISNAFGLGNNSVIRAGHPRSVTVRLALCRTCRNLESNYPDGYIDMGVVLEHVKEILPEDPPTETELIDICETEGTPTNGGGVFNFKTNEKHYNSIKYIPDADLRRTVGGPGEIGSPVVGSGITSFAPTGTIGRGNYGPLSFS